MRCFRTHVAPSRAVLAGPGRPQRSVPATARPQPRLHVVGHVYVNDNTAGTNTIAAFNRHADGTLTPVAGIAIPRRWRRLRARASRRRARSRSPTTAGICWLSMPAATRSRCCGSSDDGSLGLDSVVSSGGVHARQRRDPR